MEKSAFNGGSQIRFSFARPRPTTEVETARGGSDLLYGREDTVAAVRSGARRRAAGTLRPRWRGRWCSRRVRTRVRSCSAWGLCCSRTLAAAARLCRPSPSPAAVRLSRSFPPLAAAACLCRPSSALAARPLLLPLSTNATIPTWCLYRRDNRSKLASCHAFFESIGRRPKRIGGNVRNYAVLEMLEISKK